MQKAHRRRSRVDWDNFCRCGPFFTERHGVGLKVWESSFDIERVSCLSYVSRYSKRRRNFGVRKLGDGSDEGLDLFLVEDDCAEVWVLSELEG